MNSKSTIFYRTAHGSLSRKGSDSMKLEDLKKEIEQHVPAFFGNWLREIKELITNGKNRI